MPGPLAGFKVVDFSAVISGPLAGMILADQGADVIKVEAPGFGDLLRGEWYRRGGLTSLFANVNRGKRSIVLDLKDERGLAVAHALVREADIVIENQRDFSPFSSHANTTIVHSKQLQFGINNCHFEISACRPDFSQVSCELIV